MTTSSIEEERCGAGKPGTRDRRLTPAMRALESQLTRPLAEVLAEKYRNATLHELAREFGITPSGMSRWFTRLGIPTRRIGADQGP